MASEVIHSIMAYLIDKMKTIVDMIELNIIFKADSAFFISQYISHVDL